jgi:oligopeptide/dipeptide ABC transporter ATP-binding protein
MKNNITDTPRPVIEVSSLKVHFPIRKGIFGKTIGHVKAVDSISFSINKGDIFALVGESGCGKTTTAQAILGLIPATSGSIKLFLSKYSNNQVEWELMTPEQKRVVRKHIQVVFQDPFSSLNPRMTVHSILEEPMIIHNLYPVNERKSRIVDLLDQVGLSSEYLTRYPHEFSGGQRQRIGIARALVTNPECIVADEPVSALDVSIQAQIINLMQDLQKSHHQTQLFISHDLAVVRHIANKLAVMYMGHIVEMGTEEQVFTNPLHPYTSLLLESIPIPGKGRTTKNEQSVREKEYQNNNERCAFYPRCPRRKSECLENAQELIDKGDGHLTACFL